MQQFFI